MWELADAGNRGWLDQEAFFVALKLVSLAQAGGTIALSSLNTPSKLPDLVSKMISRAPSRLAPSRLAQSLCSPRQGTGRDHGQAYGRN